MELKIKEHKWDTCDFHENCTWHSMKDALLYRDEVVEKYLVMALQFKLAFNENLPKKQEKELFDWLNKEFNDNLREYYDSDIENKLKNTFKEALMNNEIYREMNMIPREAMSTEDVYWENGELKVREDSPMLCSSEHEDGDENED